MHIHKLLKTRFAAGLFCGTICLGLGWSPALSAPIDLEFRPPDIKVSRICTPKRPDAEIQRDWAQWDGKSLPQGQSFDMISRDLIRLRDIDAVTFFDTIMRGLEKLRQTDPNYNNNRYLIDRIKVYIKAGRIEDLKNARLVEELQANSYLVSPRAADFLADLYLNGIVVKRDSAHGMNLKIQAAYGGNANALLHLASLTSNGETVPGWDVEAPVAVTLAFGALLGKLNPTICDRIGRIAREYSSGEVVARNYALSETWYRFSADLGDTNAAWKVAEFHLDSEFIEKDNDVLLTYLKQAADAEVVSAEIELGRIYESGALTEKDTDAALKIYSRLVDEGLRVGYIRSILLRENLGLTAGEHKAGYKDLLQGLAELEDAPGWVFTKLGKQLQDEQGVWASAAEAETYFEKAAARGDIDGKYELARSYLRADVARERYNAALDLLYSTSAVNGKTEALSELRRAHFCLNQDGAQAAIQGYWQAAEDGAGSQVRLTDETGAMIPAGDMPPALVASIQTEALYGSAKSLGTYFTVLDEAGPADSARTKAFWQAYATNYPGGLASIAAREFETAESEKARAEALAALRVLADAGDEPAALDLAEILLSHYADDAEKLAEAERLAFSVKGGVRGKILRSLDDALRASGRQGLKLTGAQSELTANFGDAHALLFLAGAQTSDEETRLYYKRARGIMRCNFDTVYQFADFALDHGYDSEADRWLNVLMVLLGDKSWQYVKVADLYAKTGTDADKETAFDLYVQAYERGYDLASFRLLDALSDPERHTYDPELGRQVIASLLENADGNQLYNVIRRVERAPAEIQDPILARFDIKALYRRAAEAEYPAAMRELAKLMRTADASHEDIREASEWLKKSAAAQDPEAMVLLAQSYAFGIGVEPSRKDAVKWLRAASDAGEESAAKLLEIIQ
jgi:TPR repeat protein